jgi:hypothetical protein
LMWYNDMTATVEIKLESSSCDSFAVENHFIKDPVFKKGHGPMGQAIMHSMDTWHCLARRGVRVQTIPVVVFAGRLKPNSKKKLMKKGMKKNTKERKLNKKRKKIKISKPQL